MLRGFACGSRRDWAQLGVGGRKWIPGGCKRRWWAGLGAVGCRWLIRVFRVVIRRQPVGEIEHGGVWRLRGVTGGRRGVPRGCK